MKMNDYIDCFTDHLRHASIIGESVNLKICKKNIQNVIVCGLGGSGIGGGVAAASLDSHVDGGCDFK